MDNMRRYIAEMLADFRDVFGIQSLDRVMIGGPSGFGKSTLGFLLEHFGPYSVAADIDDYAFELYLHDKVYWVVNPNHFGGRISLVSGCCDNYRQLVEEFKPNVVLFPIPDFDTYIKAVTLKAEALGPNHAFYSHMVEKSTMSSDDFVEYARTKLQEYIDECSGLCKVVPTIAPVVEFQKHTGWFSKDNLRVRKTLDL